MFAIHHPYEFVPKGGKIIYCFRDQKDANLSNYHFFNLLVSLRGRVSLPVFTQHLMLERVELYLKDLLVWWDHRYRHDNNLLVLFFISRRITRDVYTESPNLWVLNVMMALSLVLFTPLPTLKWLGITQSLVCVGLPHSRCGEPRRKPST